MKTLIIYASNSGSTYLTSKIIKEVLEENKNEVTLTKASDVDVATLAYYDTILIGSPSWYVNKKEGQPHETILEFIEKSNEINLSDKHMTAFGCGDSSYLTFCGAVDHLEEFIKKTKAIKLSDSLRIDSFYFDIDKNTQMIKQWANSLSKVLPVSSLI